jgi:hypothetical protein
LKVFTIKSDVFTMKMVIFTMEMVISGEKCGSGGRWAHRVRFLGDFYYENDVFDIEIV